MVCLSAKWGQTTAFVALMCFFACISASAQPKPIVVAVIDSGVLAGDPELQGLLLSGYDMVAAPNNGRGQRSPNFTPNDAGSGCENRSGQEAINMHGTWVARLAVAAATEDSAPSIAVLPIRVHNGCRIARQDMLDAMAWAAGLHVQGLPENPTPARIINLSLSGSARVCGADLQALISNLLAHHVYIVVAAGNNFQRGLHEPANCDGVIAVGAVDAHNRIASYSALDPRISLYAYGGNRTLRTSDTLVVKSVGYDLADTGGLEVDVVQQSVGTSFAAPLVTGYLARWLWQNPEKQLEQFRQELPSLTQPLGSPTTCARCMPRVLIQRNGLHAP